MPGRREGAIHMGGAFALGTLKTIVIALRE